MARWQRRATASNALQLPCDEVQERNPGASVAAVETASQRRGLRWRKQSNVCDAQIPRKVFFLEDHALQDVDENMVALAVSRGMCQRSKLSLASPIRLLQMPQLTRDFATVLEGGAHHLKSIFCPADDRALFLKLKAEIEDTGLWRKRALKGRSGDSYEHTIAPETAQRSTSRINGEDALTLEKLPAHKYVLEHLTGLFNAETLSWWINLYPSGRDRKSFHKDNFGQNITIGASFGAARNLSFRHTESRDEFHFPQDNGDVFAFREGVNDAFLHGIHPLSKDQPDPGPRISVIIMGRTRG